jgi:ribokinase
MHAEPGQPFDVVGLGQCCMDHLGKIEAFPLPDTKCEFHGLTIQCGGPVATALTALSRWGLRCAFQGTVGDDLLAEEIRATLAADGVDIGGLITRAGGASQFAFVAVQPGIGHRTIFWQRAMGAAVAPGEVDLDAVRSARLFHTDGLHAAASVAAARAARRAGTSVMVDAGTLRDGMLELAPFADYYIASERFAHALVARHDPDAACEEMLSRGALVAGVTLGADGYLVRTADRRIRGAAYPVEPVDTTGCGDIFHAGLAYGALQEWPLDDALDFAAWAAAQVSLHLGGRTGIPNPADWPGAA